MQESLRPAAARPRAARLLRGSAWGCRRNLTASGTIARLDADRQTLVVKVGSDEVTFVWNAETRINGVLAPGARVTVRYAPQPDGRNLAFQISVGKRCQPSARGFQPDSSIPFWRLADSR